MKILSCYWQIEDAVKAWPEPVGEHVIPSLLRRRLTDLGKMAFNGFYALNAQVDGQHMPWVVACRHGDTTRMNRLLTELAVGETLSPTDFSLSVHNAIAAQFAIATGNKKMQTALSGGEQSFELGLLEAYALQKETNDLVGYIYYDQPLPSQYALACDVPKVCIAMLLSGEANSQESIDISYKPLSDAAQSGFLEFVDFMENDKQEIQLRVPGGTFTMEHRYG
ncbi:MAG: beta-ketoacyl synthase chain length factor [Candidatus Paracaedibacteraceae bacterium]|nr:beta-ketoacyl synthase chain length factor [Candidatus Paracaedibacteraceae bacterium]